MLDGSAKGWVEAIEQVGLCAAEDSSGHNMDKLAPELHEPMYLRRNDSFVAAFPSSKVQITYGIDFPEVLFFLWPIATGKILLTQAPKSRPLTAANLFSFFKDIFRENSLKSVKKR